MVVKSPTLELDSFADLHERLGFVPLHRICMNPPPGRATEDDVIRFAEAANKRLYELIDGTLVEKAMGFPESVIGAFLIRVIGVYADENDLGLLGGADGAFRLEFGQVRYPDVSFIPWREMPDDELPDEKLSTLVPSLVVEVLSESNTVAEITRKREQFFAKGCRLFWVIDPQTQTADVYTSTTRVKHLDASGTLEGGKVLPGFSLPLAQVFAAGRRKPRKKKS
jgi:Uma2 family endonuclease